MAICGAAPVGAKVRLRQIKIQALLSALALSEVLDHSEPEIVTKTLESWALSRGGGRFNDDATIAVLRVGARLRGHLKACKGC